MECRFLSLVEGLPEGQQERFQSALRIASDDEEDLLEFCPPADSAGAQGGEVWPLVSPVQVDAFTGEVLHAVVNERLGFVLADRVWTVVDEAFEHYWDVEVGLGGMVDVESMFFSMRGYLAAAQVCCTDGLLYEMVSAIADFIVQIPGVIVDD